MRRRRFVAGLGTCFLCGCAGSVHRLPQVSGSQLQLAQAEVGGTAGPPSRRAISDAEALDTMQSALRRVRPAADTLCREMGVGVCNWTFRASPDRTLNAGAGPNGLIVINRGIVEFAANEEEVALVIAHEIGHQAANHVATGQRNQAVGALLGAIIVGAALAYGGRGGGIHPDLARNSMEAAANLGGAIGRISFSKEQEREADYLAAVILYRAGVDLTKARGFLVTMARSSGRAETGMLDTHPAGPERIAGWDHAVEEIKATNGRLPPRAA